MSNIYNKFIITKDGTLIGNWQEEGQLREKTGEGRTITGNQFGKFTFDPENFHSDPNPKNDTFKRVIGEKEPQKNYFVHSSLYGQKNSELLKYTHEKLNKQADLAKLLQKDEESAEILKSLGYK